MPAMRLVTLVVMTSGLLLSRSPLAAAIPPPLDEAPKDSPTPPDPPASCTVLEGALIHTMTDRGSFEGSVVVRGSAIVEVGVDVDVPKGAVVVDVRGCTLIPGLIDARSVLWLTEAARQESGSRGALSVLDGIDPWRGEWADVARQGVTSVYVQPNSRGSLGGLGAVLRVAPADDLESLVVKRDAGVQASIGITGSSTRERHSQYQRLRTALENIKEGKDPGNLEEESTEETTERPQRRGRGRRGRFSRGGFGRSRTRAPSQPDQTKKILERVMNGDMPLRLEIHHPETVPWALSLARDFDIDLVLDGVSNPGAHASELASRRTSIVLGPVFELGTPPSYRNDRPENWIRQLTSSSDRWTLGTFGEQGRSSKSLRLQGSAAISQGASSESTLRAMTLEAARVLGIDDSRGSIDNGKVADIAVFSGDPLDPAIPARLVMSSGEITYENAATPEKALACVETLLPDSLPSSYVLHTRHLLGDGVFEERDLHVSEGRIVAIAPKIDVSLPRYDIGDAVITPGLVATQCYLGQESALGDDVESDFSHFRALDGVDPHHDAATAMLHGGFIHVAIAPTSTNTSAGILGELRLGAAQPLRGRTIAGKFVLSSPARNDNRFPASLSGQIDLLDTILAGQAPPSRMVLPEAAMEHWMAERAASIDAVVSKRRPALFEVRTIPEVRAALAMVSRHGLRASLLGPQKIGDLLEPIVANNVGIIARGVKGNDRPEYLDEMARAARAGVPIAFSGASPLEIRATAALAVEAGMPRQSALRGLTSTAAELVGMDANSARLAPGAPADFVIWNGTPLNLGARPLRVIVAGRQIDPKDVDQG